MFSVIIPVYRNEASVGDLLEALAGVSYAFEVRFGQDLEAIFVIDGSPDRCFELLAANLPASPFRSRVVLHSRNFGSFAAIRTGLAAASGDHFGVIAADLQEPPELLLDFFEALADDRCDVVVGRRDGRADPPTSRWASTLFWRIYRRLIMPEVPNSGVDVFGCNRQFRDELLKLDESNSSLIGLLFWLGFRRTEVSYERLSRKHGASAWTLGKKFNYLFDSVFSFTDLPIRLLVAFGLLGIVLACVLGAAIALARLVGNIDVPGYAATALIILLFGGLNALGLGIVGTYAWRGFENTKRRPLAVVMRCLSIAPATLHKINKHEGSSQ